MILKSIKRSSMKAKIIFLVALPILAYLTMATSRIMNAQIGLSMSNDMSANLDAIESLSEVVKNTQVERGKSAVFAKSNGKLGLDFLSSQRSKVDEAIKAATPHVVSASDSEAKQNVINSLASISALRSTVNGGAAPKEFLGKYTKIIENIHVFQLATTANASAETGMLINSLVRLEKAREASGLYRAKVSSAFQADQPLSTKMAEDISSLASKIDSNLDLGFLHIAEATKSKIAGLGNAPHWQDKQKYLNLVFERFLMGGYGKEGPATFAVLTKVVNDIGELIAAQIATTRTQLKEEHASVKSDLVLRSIESAVLLSILCFLVYLFIKSFDNDIKKVLASLQEANEQISSSSDQIAKSGSDLSSASHEASSAIQETVSSISEISSMVAQANDRVRSAADSSDAVSKRVNSGENMLEELLVSMKSIATATESLDDINKSIDSIAMKTGVINDIVFKTQLLSFNASIEAANAGEHGKGFSVVAEEVGKLAEMSGAAAAEISTLLTSSRQTIASSIKQSQDLIKEGLDKSNEVSDIFSMISEDIKQIDGNTKDIMHASSEQQMGIEQVNTAINEIDQSVQQNAQSAETAENQATGLGNNSENLAKATSNLVRLVFGYKGLEEGAIKSTSNRKVQIKSQNTDKKSDNNEDRIDADHDSFNPAA